MHESSVLTLSLCWTLRPTGRPVSGKGQGWACRFLRESWQHPRAQRILFSGRICRASPVQGRVLQNDAGRNLCVGRGRCPICSVYRLFRFELDRSDGIPGLREGDDPAQGRQVYPSSSSFDRVATLSLRKRKLFLARRLALFNPADIFRTVQGTKTFFVNFSQYWKFVVDVSRFLWAQS